MADDWDFYPCHVNHSPATIFLNLGIAQAVPRHDLPVLLWAWVKFRNPNEDGFPIEEEAEALFAIEDKLLEAAERDCTALFIGRITTAGRREFYFYAPAAEGWEATLAEVFAPFAEYEYQGGDQADSEWLHYRDVLFPHPDDMQWILNRRVVDNLQQHGDNLAAPREVDHFLYFPSGETRQAFIDEVTPNGFSVAKLWQSERPTDDCPFALHIVRTDPVELGAIHPIVLELVDGAARHRGAYDGWGAPIVPGEAGAGG
jgi:uncharacterized protein (TIGR01619 family)